MSKACLSILSLVYEDEIKPSTQNLILFLLKLSQKGTDHVSLWVGQETPEVKGLDLRGRKNKDFWGLFSQILKIVKEKSLPIIHCHSPELFFPALAVARVKKLKVVYTVHSPRSLEVPHFLLKACHRIVVTSSRLLALAENQCGLPKSKLQLIFNGIDFDKMSFQASHESPEHLRTQLGLSPHRFVIGNFGPLILEEDHLTLLKAFRKLNEKKLDAELLLVGHGPTRKDIDQFIEKHDLSSRVKILDTSENICALHHAMDVLIYPSYGHDRSDAILMASAMGKPVIATKIGNHEDVIQENKTGYLVPCGFPERIDSAVMRLKAIHTLAEEIGQNGVHFVKEEFSIDGMGKKYLELYKTL